jgi:glycosyltransferase involved in cell wall biosynthesis
VAAVTALRILMMADTPADPNRGAAGTEVQTARALRDLGHDVDTLWADDLGRRIRHGNLHLLLELPRTYARAAVRALQRKPYDVMHVNQPHGFRAAPAVHRLSPRTAFIHRSHGFELHVEEALAPWRRDERGVARRFASAALAPLLARHSHAIARVADGHVVSSSLDAAFLHERLDVPREKIAVVPQAAPDDYLRLDASPMTDMRLRRVLYVGQFAFVKAPEIVAQAMNRLAAAMPDVHFTWVCDRAHHGDVRALLSAEANARAELLHWTTQEELRGIYDGHGLFLFPSFFEGFGKAFLEAMSRGLCVVASDAGGMHDLMEHGRNGCLVPAGDAESVADAALALLRDPARAASMSAAAAETARAYTWTRVARELTAFYEARLTSRR